MTHGNPPCVNQWEDVRMPSPQAKRNDQLQMAKEYAKVRKWNVVLLCLARAAKHYPMTPMQEWGLRKLVGEYKFEELNMGRYFKEQEQ